VGLVECDHATDFWGMGTHRLDALLLVPRYLATSNIVGNPNFSVRSRTRRRSRSRARALISGSLPGNRQGDSEGHGLRRCVGTESDPRWGAARRPASNGVE
jgi:hypothetical protein